MDQSDYGSVTVYCRKEERGREVLLSPAPNQPISTASCQYAILCGRVFENVVRAEAEFRRVPAGNWFVLAAIGGIAQATITVYPHTQTQVDWQSLNQ